MQAKLLRGAVRPGTVGTGRLALLSSVVIAQIEGDASQRLLISSHSWDMFALSFSLLKPFRIQGGRIELKERATSLELAIWPFISIGGHFRVAAHDSLPELCSP